MSCREDGGSKSNAETPVNRVAFRLEVGAKLFDGDVLLSFSKVGGFNHDESGVGKVVVERGL